MVSISCRVVVLRAEFFLPDLTKPNFTPGHTPSVSYNRSAPVLSDVESVDEAPTAVVIPSRPVRPPVVIGGGTPDLIIEEARRASPKTTPPVSPANGLKPLILGSTGTAPSVSSPLTSRTPELTPTGPRKMNPRKPSQPRLVISNPRLRRDQLDSSAFERPRRAPMIDPS